ncbi:MAG: vWA domain-containing protein [Luteolibacter sp.]
MLRQLIEESRPKTTRFHRSGSRLDLRMAMQFDADPRQYEHLYLRRTLPSHPDPAFIILADESSSMRGERARATFEAVVVLREVCLRLGIPLAIVGFGSRTRNIQGWEDENGIKVRRKVSALLDPSGSRSDLRPALDNAQMLLSSLNGSSRPRIWILSDGEVSDPDAVRKIINQIRISGIPVHGLGLGPDSHGLAQVIPDAAIGISAGELAQFFARLLQAQANTASSQNCSA